MARRLPSPYGTLVVLRHALRAQPRWRPLLLACGAAAGIAVVSMELRPVLLGPAADLVSPTAGTLPSWLTVSMVAAVLVLLPLAALVGAAAAPSKEADPDTQTTLLSPWDVCCGRLLAAVLPLIATTVGSLLFWLAVRVRYHAVVRGEGAGLKLAAAHLALVCAVAMVAAVSACFGFGRTRGHAYGTGAVAGLALAAACLCAVFAAAPLAARSRNPSPVIAAALAVNPVYVVEAALGRDVTRISWVYDHTGVADYEHADPPPIASAAGFAAVGLGALALAGARFGRGRT